MSNHQWLEACPDAKLKELQKIAASQVAFRNIPVWQRLVMCIILGVPLLASLAVVVGVLMRASQAEQFMALVGCAIGVAVWAINREAKKRRAFLQMIQAEVERRQL